MNNTNKTLVFISRLVVGLVFIYSGFVKGIDPLGSTYKFDDYFTAFGSEWASFLSFTLAIVLSLVEFIIGFAILLQLRMKEATWGALILMLIFTPLTLILAITNPVHDCGCFGDALVLTNWQTFWKNVILLIPVVYLFLQRNKINNKLSNTEQWTILGVSSLAMLIISIHSYQHLPLLDFRPYKIGTHIPEGMSIPEGAAVDEYQSVFIYSKDGVEQNFDLNNLPDSTWTFVDASHVLVKKGYEPPIHDFSISSQDGTEITDLVLASDNYNFLLVSYNVEMAMQKDWTNINQLYDFCYAKDYPFYALSASTNDQLNELIEAHQINFEFYITDETTLKTIIRSNPGLLLIKDGVIINKWHYNDIPEASYFEKNILGSTLSHFKQDGNKKTIWLLLLFTAFIAVLYLGSNKNKQSVKNQ